MKTLRVDEVAGVILCVQQVMKKKLDSRLIVVVLLECDRMRMARGGVGATYIYS